MFMRGNPRIDGNLSDRTIFALLFLRHHDRSRRQLVALDLAVLPPSKGCPIGNAHLVRILTQLHEASMSYLSLCINRYHHFQKLVCTPSPPRSGTHCSSSQAVSLPPAILLSLPWCHQCMY